MARGDLGPEDERGEAPAETEEDAVEVDGDDGDVRGGYDGRFGMDGGVAADPEHHQTLGESAVNERAFPAPRFDDEGEHETGGDKFDDTVDSGSEQRCRCTREAERSKYLRRVVVDRVRSGPLLEEGEEGWDETTKRDNLVLPHLAELCEQAEPVTANKVRTDLREGRLDLRRGRVGARNIGEGCCRIFITFFFDQPTGRFWLEKHEKEEQNTRDDLNDDRKAPLYLPERDLNRCAVVHPD